MNENQLDAEVRRLAEQAGVHAHHKRDSRDEPPGFPDWVLIGPHGVLWREAKTEIGQLSVEQRMIGMALTSNGHNWSVWRPRDLRSGRIKRELAAIGSAVQARPGCPPRA